MKKKIFVIIIALFGLIISNNAQSVYTCNGTNVNVRASNCTTATSFGQVSSPHSFVVLSTTGTNCGYTWYQIDIPSAHLITQITAYVATNYFSISGTSNNYCIVQNAPSGLKIKNAVGGSQTWIYDGSVFNWASFENGQYLARTSSSPVVSGSDTWYEVYLTTNCYNSNSTGSGTRTTGWVSNGISSGGPYVIPYGGSAPVASFTVSQNIISQGGTITTTNNSSGNPIPTYSWSALPSTGVSFSPSSTATNPSITFTNTGTFTIYLTATNSNGSDQKSKTIIVNTVTYWIGFSTIVDGNASLGWDKLITSGTSNMGSPPPAKICADGSKATILRVTCSDSTIDMTQIKFRIAGTTNINYDGYFNSANYTSTFNQTETRYSHPTVMNISSPYDTRTIEIYNQNNPSVNLFTYPIKIYKAPVLMVHGLWGDVNSFSEMETFLLNSGAYPPFAFDNSISSLLFRIDYRESNDFSFGYNSQKVPIGINSLLYNARWDDFSVGKVDIVAHSMGGLLTRIYLENIYGNQYRNDIHKFITLNTPHSGTQGANMLYYWPLLCTTTGLFMASPSIGCSDAVKNLRVNSSDIGQLNNSGNLYLNNVPTFAIVTEDQSINDFTNCSLVINDLLGLLASSNSISNGDKLLYLSNLFNFEYSDLIVPASSQQGGISKYEYFYNQCHLKSPNNIDIKNKVFNLLNDFPNSNFFDVDGYSPPSLAAPNPIYYKSQSSQTTYSIHIDSPLSGTLFSSGSTVSIITSGDNSTSNLSVYAGNTYVQDFTQVSSSANNSFSYTIPSDAAGIILIEIIGVDSTGAAAMDTVTINVMPSASLDSMSHYPAQHYIPKGKVGHTNIIGYYSDGVDRNISDILGLSVSITDTNIAKMISPPYLIFGVDTSTTTATYSYQGKSFQVPIAIYQGEPWFNTGIEENNNGNVHDSSNTNSLFSIFPNPSNNLLNVKGQGLANDNYKIILTNTLGQALREKEIKSVNNFLETQLDISNLANGIYFVKICSEKKSFSKKVIIQ